MSCKKYFIRTYGCQMNRADSGRFAAELEESGCAPASVLEEADILVINTCSVRQASEDKVYGLAPEVLRLKDGNRRLKVILTGCLLGSALGERKRLTFRELRAKVPWVDCFFPSKDFGENIREMLGGTLGKGRTEKRRESAAGRAGEKNPKVGSVSIMEGCDNFCSYCVVPYARGREVSRPLEEVLVEVKNLVRGGCEEIVLLGQNVNSYHKNLEFKVRSATLRSKVQRLKKQYRSNFAVLLALLNEIKGLKTIRFLTSNPWDLTAGIIEALALPKVERYLHLPVQSGDDAVLKRMNRGYTAADYVALVKKVRRRVPGIRVGTDIIVGFPGETREQFENTVKLCREVKFDNVFVAVYSPRRGTAAARLSDNVSPREKKRRYKALIEAVENVKKSSALVV